MRTGDRRLLLGSGVLVVAVLWAALRGPGADRRSLGPQPLHTTVTAGADPIDPVASRSRPPGAPTDATHADVAPGWPRPAYRDDLLLVQMRASGSAPPCAELGCRWDRAPNAHGLGALRVEPASRAEVLRRLARDPGVAHASAMGVTYGAGGKVGPTPKLSKSMPRSLQWHLDAAGLGTPPTTALEGVVVAVLDTGLAPIPSLASVAVVDPWDFVHDDDDPQDDHHHGTHTASLIASQGVVRGAAPGVSLMPLKVLDESNTGVELDLVAALVHAVEHGADVINLSLSFAPGYAPSEALVDALEAARAAGVVVVAAAGNDTWGDVSYPAAHPFVISVGAATLSGPGSAAADTTSTSYTNLGGALELLAPGGDLTQDADGNGYPDGLLAESIAPGDPTTTGYWWAAGTSQATAVASGAAARLLADGQEPFAVIRALQCGATYAHGDGFELGEGAGALSYVDSSRPSCTTKGSDDRQHTYAGALLPFLAKDGDTLLPSAVVAIADDDGGPVQGGISVVVSLDGASQEILTCKPAAGQGVCVVQGAPRTDLADDATWSFRIDAAVDAHGVGTAPVGALFTSEVFDGLLDALKDDPATTGLPLAFWWDEVDDDELGPMSEAWAVSFSGAGLATSPLGLLLRPGALTAVSTTSLDLSGTGLATSPLGTTTIRKGELALAGGSTTLAAIEGNGLATSPLGFHALSTSTWTTTSSPVWGSTGLRVADASADASFSGASWLDQGAVLEVVGPSDLSSTALPEDSRLVVR